MTDAQSAGNKTKYAYYYTTWSDTCQIRSYNGQNTCAGLHADGVQSLAAGNEKNYLTNMAIWESKNCLTLIEDDYVFYPFAAPVVIEEPVYVDPVVVVDPVPAPVATFEWATLPESIYVDNSLKCAAFKTKMTDAQSAGNKTKYAYYYTTWSDTCQIRSYNGQNTCAGLHADGVQSLAAGNENNYLQNMGYWNAKNCLTLIEDDYVFYPFAAPVVVDDFDYVDRVVVVDPVPAPVAIFEWASLPVSTYVDNSLKCLALHTKMTDAQSAGNKTKYAYYFTTYSDTCQIRSYRGQNTCAGLHADGVQSLAAGNEKNYLTNMAIWESKSCRTLIADDYIFSPLA